MVRPDAEASHTVSCCRGVVMGAMEPRERVDATRIDLITICSSKGPGALPVGMDGQLLSFFLFVSTASPLHPLELTSRCFRQVIAREWFERNTQLTV